MDSQPSTAAAPRFLSDGGEMGARIRAFDWSETPLGDPSTWPVPLRTAVRLMLTTRHPVFLFWGEEHRCLYNDAYRGSIGYDKHPRILGAPAREAWPEIWHIIGPQIEHVMQGHGATWHENHLVPIDRDGRREDVYWTYGYSPIDDEAALTGVGGVLVLCTETTEEVRTRECLADTARSLARERERLAIALRIGRMGVYEWRVGAAEAWWSPEIFAVYGADPATFTPTLEAFGALIHPDDREELWRRTEECIARREVFRHEYRILRPDGQVRWVANQSHVGLGVDGEVERITGVAVDITERKRAEQALQEADRRKDEFLATLAHELRNPLAPIRNAVGILDLRGGGDPELRTVRDVIRRQVDHMVRLVDDLLDVSRITRNTLTLRPEPVAVAGAIEQAVEAVKPQIERARQRLRVMATDASVRVFADPVRLVQVLTNLLGNASKYSPPETGITVSTAVERGEVAIAVEDEGIGIDAAQLPRLFEMFSQATPALERSQGGLGIGLWLSRKLVEMQGGRIAASSEGPHRGSRFEVRLPLEPAAAKATGTHDGQVPHAHTARRVLLVEDNVDGAKTLAALLASTGNEVVTAFDGVEALAALERFTPDVALLDIGLPKMNGYDVCRQLRSRFGSEIMVVAMTGWGQEEDRRRAAEAGFDRHLVKPVDFTVLVDILAGEPG